jgi:hypothetical protein
MSRRDAAIAAPALYVAVAAGCASTPPAPTEAAAVRHYRLADLRLAATPEQRHFLSYLVSCALPATVEVEAETEREKFSFRGAMGLAPNWVERGLTLSEQRWVTACILARTNKFGSLIRISMRAQPPPVPALEASWQERLAYPLFEGGFFGNLFADPPVAYSCIGNRDPGVALDRFRPMPADSILPMRVCTESDYNGASSQLPLTRCGFVDVGACQTTRFLVDDGFYDEVIFTYLPR